MRVNIENRFYLIVDPDRAATSVENVGEEVKGEEARGSILQLGNYKSIKVS